MADERVIEGVLSAAGFRQTNGKSFAVWLAAHDDKVKSAAFAEVRAVVAAEALVENLENPEDQGYAEAIDTALWAIDGLVQSPTPRASEEYVEDEG